MRTVNLEPITNLFTPSDLPRIALLASSTYKRCARVHEWVERFPRPFVLVTRGQGRAERMAEGAAHARQLQVLRLEGQLRAQVFEVASRVIVFWNEVDSETRAVIREASRVGVLWRAYGATGEALSPQRVAEIASGW